jgi:hypothetical protein
MLLKTYDRELFSWLNLTWTKGCGKGRCASVAEVDPKEIEKRYGVYWTHPGWRAAKFKDGEKVIGGLREGDTIGVIWVKGGTNR